jgi:hypothetical protein
MRIFVVLVLLLFASIAHARTDLTPACGLAGSSSACTTVNVDEEFFVVGCGLHPKLDSADGTFTATTLFYLFDVAPDGCIYDWGSPTFTASTPGTYTITVSQDWGGKRHVVGSTMVDVVP